MSAGNRFCGRLLPFFLWSCQRKYEQWDGSLEWPLCAGMSEEMLKKKKEKRIGTHPCCKSLPTFRRGSPAPLRSVPVMEWTALISFRSLQRSIVLLYKCIHLKIVNTSSFIHYIDATEALKYFYLTAVHKKIAIFLGMFLSEVIISYQKAFLHVLTDENYRSTSKMASQTFLSRRFI